MSQTFVKPEYIYIIAEKTTKVGTGGYTGYFKVGRTDDLQERVKELQTANPHQLQCGWYIKVDPSQKNTAEKAAHAAAYVKYRSGENGGTEWYYVPFQVIQDFLQLILCGVKAANVEVLDTNIVEVHFTRWKEPL